MIRALCGVLIVLGGSARAQELGSISAVERLGRSWNNELVHTDVRFPGGVPAALEMVDDTGKRLPLQLSDEVSSGGRVTQARVWTVVSLAPHTSRRLSLRIGRGAAPSGPAPVSVAESPGGITVDNGLARVVLPRYAPGTCAELTRCPPPLTTMSRHADGADAWRSSWHAQNAAPAVRATSTEVVERGPVRATIRQRVTFANGRVYSFTVSLAAGQSAVRVEEDGSAANNVSLRLSVPGSDRMVWMNQGTDSALAKRWAVSATPLAGAPGRLIELRPFSFWWLPDLSEWIGLYHSGSATQLGLVLLRPSLWSPITWTGFAQSAFTVTRSGGTAQTDLPLLDGALHREWALTADEIPASANPTARAQTLREHLVQQSEVPLDDVLRWPFDVADRGPHPRLLITAADLQRTRNTAQRAPLIASQVQTARDYLRRCGEPHQMLAQGAPTFYTQHWIGNRLINSLPTVFLTDADPSYGKMLAAAVLGLSNDLRRELLDGLDRPALGAWGPWITSDVLRLAIYDDLVASSGALTADQERDVHATLILAARALANEDYWSTTRGLASANPNMTSSIVLARGVLALYLDGDPTSAATVATAQAELDRELNEWVTPGGAWVEAPGYQSVTMESMLVFATALKNHRGRDFFADQRLRSTMDYYGALLTPPDPRFAKGPVSGIPATLPSIGDTFAGWITGLNGWIAAATASTQPAFSRVQQFYFNAQRQYLGGATLVGPLLVALVDPNLPAVAPDHPSASFPGFGATLRGSYDDPRTTYVAHRTGPNLDHYHDDTNAIVLYAKGAPLCVDFGNDYQPVRRDEAWYHNRVSFGDASTPLVSSHGQPGAFLSLPGVLDYSTGTTLGSGNQRDERHVIVVHAKDSPGATYVVLHDTATTPKTQPLIWNLWCLADTVAVDGSAVAPTAEARLSPGLLHNLAFTGQLGVDLDVTLMSRAQPVVHTDQWQWKQDIYVWHDFSERQLGVHARENGTAADFLAVLWPRLKNERGARVTSIADGDGALVEYAGGVDAIVDAAKPVDVTRGDVAIHAHAAFVRASRSEQRLAVLDGAGTIAAANWSLSGEAPVAASIAGNALHAQVVGPQTVVVHTPRAMTPRLQPGQGVTLSAHDREWRLAVTAGTHAITIQW